MIERSQRRKLLIAALALATVNCSPDNDTEFLIGTNQVVFVDETMQVAPSDRTLVQRAKIFAQQNSMKFHYSDGPNIGDYLIIVTRRNLNLKLSVVFEALGQRQLRLFAVSAYAPSPSDRDAAKAFKDALFKRARDDAPLIGNQIAN